MNGFAINGILVVGLFTVYSGHAQTFKKQVLSEKYYAEGAEIADINLDGVPDIVSGPYWYQGPDFKKTHEIYAPKEFNSGLTDNRGVYVYDFTGNGFPDLIRKFDCCAKGLTLMVNPGTTGGAWKHVPIADLCGNETPFLVDITGDGKPEFITMVDGIPGFYAPNWQQPLQKWKWYPVSTKKLDMNDGQILGRHGIGVGDINRDGKMDLIYPTGWYEQPAEGALSSAWKHHPATFLQQLYLDEKNHGGAHMYLYDVDGDGDLDIATSLQAHGRGLSWFENVDGMGAQWKEHRLMDTPENKAKFGVYFSMPHSMNWADFDGDGHPDFVLGKRYYTHGPKLTDGPPVLYLFKLKRDGLNSTFLPILVDDIVGVGNQIGVGDVNGDGMPDIVVATPKGTYLYINTTKPPLSSLISQSDPNTIGFLKLYHFDGKLLLEVNNGVRSMDGRHQKSLFIGTGPADTH